MSCRGNTKINKQKISTAPQLSSSCPCHQGVWKQLKYKWYTPLTMFIENREKTSILLLLLLLLAKSSTICRAFLYWPDAFLVAALAINSVSVFNTAAHSQQIIKHNMMTSSGWKHNTYHGLFWQMECTINTTSKLYTDDAVFKKTDVSRTAYIQNTRLKIFTHLETKNKEYRNYTIKLWS